MRKLATIQKIISINPIPNADAIDVAQVLGWKVVVKKNDFKVGDLCVYCEIDSLFPKQPEFEFLKNSNYRIRTVKLRGQISQGICFPLSILAAELQQHINKLENEYINNIVGAVSAVGIDMTNTLHIEKYEAPIPAELAGDAKGALPSFFQVTDEERIQNLPHILQQYAGQRFIATEKLDGSSCSFYWCNGVFGVCGRNWEYYESPTNSMWKFANENKLEFKLGKLGRNLAIQGEIIGEGIQGNKYKLRGQIIRFFRIFDIDNYEYLSYEEMLKIIILFDLKTVPIINYGYVLPSTVDEILADVQGKSLYNLDVEREGIVFVKYEKNNQGRLGFKAISNQFLLDNKE